jgi:hypothetical protein
MIEHLKVLKMGVAKVDYPVYAQAVNFKNGHEIQTYNNKIFVSVRDPHPFNGATNFYVLESILNRLGTATEMMIQEGELLKITTEDGFNAALPIEDVGFPEVEDFDVDMHVFTTDTLNILSTAIKFTGANIYSYVYVDDYCITATDGRRLFYHQFPERHWDSDVVMGINNKIYSVLEGGSAVGTKEWNMKVVNGNVILIFSIDVLDSYPIDKIKPFILESREKCTSKLCNVAVLKDLSEKASTVLTGDTTPAVKLHNKDKVLTLSAESLVTGSSSVTAESFMDEEFSMMLNPKMLRDISLDFNVFVGVDVRSRLYMKNDSGAEIAMMGLE